MRAFGEIDSSCGFFDPGKAGDGIPQAEEAEEDEEAAAAAAAEAAAEAASAAKTTPDDWRGWVAGAMAMDSFKIKKTSKKGNVRQVDLRPQLLNLEYMDQAEVTAALEGKHVPIPPVPQPGTALLRFKGEYTGAGGLSVDGMAKILGAAAGGIELQVLHSHRTGINLTESTPPKVDKLWMDNIVRAEAFMGLERIWNPEKGENNRGHMGDKGGPGDRIDNHKDYRPAEEEKDLPPGRNTKWMKK